MYVSLQFRGEGRGTYGSGSKRPFQQSESRDITFHLHMGSRERNKQWGHTIKSQSLPLVIYSLASPPKGFHNHLKKASPIRNKLFRYMSLWEAFLIHASTVATLVCVESGRPCIKELSQLSLSFHIFHGRQYQTLPQNSMCCSHGPL